MVTTNILNVEQKKTDFDDKGQKTKVIEMRILAQNKSEVSLKGNNKNTSFIKTPFSKIVKQDKKITPKDFLR